MRYPHQTLYRLITPKEHAAFLAAIKRHMDRNQAIPLDVFCTLTEAVVHLLMYYGVSVYRKQYRLAYHDRPIVAEAIKKWKADGIIHLGKKVLKKFSTNLQIL